MKSAAAFVILILSGFFAPRCGATVYHSDGSAVNVQLIHDIQAIDGDTITIPAGTFTWSTGATITKGIKIQGAGSGRVEGTSTSSLTIGTGSKSFTVRSGSTINGFTVGETVTAHQKYISTNWMKGTVTSWDGTTLVLNITSTSGSGAIVAWVFEMDATTILVNAGSSTLFTITASNSQSTEIYGIRFTKNPAVPRNFTAEYINVGSVSNGQPVLIHDCRFSSTIATTYVRHTVNRGIVYKCYFDRGFNWYDGGTNTIDNSNGLHCDLSSGGTSWTTANTMGDNDTTGLNNIYIEDCFFTGFHLGLLDFSNNVRGVIRHCVWDNSACTIHGPDTDTDGMRHSEFYDNVGIFDGTFAHEDWVANMNYWITWRGGSGVVTDNALDNIVSWAWAKGRDKS